MNNRFKGLVTCFISMVMLISGGCDNTNNPASTSEDKFDTMTEAVSTQSSLSDNMSERTTAATKNVTSETSGSDESETQPESYDMWSVLPYIDETPVKDIIYEKITWFRNTSEKAEGIKVTGFNTEADAVRIPDTIDGLPVIDVELYKFDVGGEETLAHDATPKELIVPDTVQQLSFNKDTIEYLNIPEAAFVGVPSYGDYSGRGVTVEYTALKGLYLCSDSFNSVMVKSCKDIEIVKNGQKYTSDNIDDINEVCVPYFIEHTIFEPTSYFGEEVEIVEYYDFRHCFNVVESVEIPDYVNKISYNAFRDCTLLKSVVLPHKVKYIGGHFNGGLSDVFSGCTSLTEMTIGMIENGVGSLNTVTRLTLREELFEESSVITLSVFPNLEYVTIEDGVTELPVGFFSGCEKLKGVTLPSSLVKIGYDAFKSCSALESISIPDTVTLIGSSAFKDCAALESITIPDSVTNIGDSAFSGCTALESITVPDSVTELGDSVFENCSALREINLGRMLHTIGSNAFSGCAALESIDIPDGVTQFGAPFDQGSGDGWSAFYGCTNLKTVNLPDSLKGLGMWTFVDCDSLRYIRLPDNIEWIGSHLLGHDSNHGASVTFVYGSAMFITFSDRDENKYKTITVSYKGNDYTGYKEIEQLHEMLLPEIPYEYSHEHYQEFMKGEY